MSEEGNEEVWTKVCPRCSIQSQTSGTFCPHCGASYTGRRRSKSVKWIGIGLAVALLLGAGAAGVILKVRHDDKVQAQEDAAEERKAEAAAQENADDAERRLRRESVREMEASILKDARNKVDSGLLTGPIFHVTCTALGGGSTDDLTALTGTFECLAINEKHDDGTEEGYVFSASVDWDEGSYSWRLGRN